MNLLQEAELLEKKGKDIEKINPMKARAFFLEAAELYIELSKKVYNNQDYYIEKAERLYELAKNLDETSEENNLEELKFNKPRITFKDIAGMEELKEEIRMKIIEPLKNPELFEYFDQKAGGGILMFGPPGCGKSLIAEATAGEAQVVFFHVKASDLKSKWFGETEKNIASLFAMARQNQPCIIFFDEFESLGGERISQSEHNRNAISQLLTEMDGIGSKEKQILLLAATNEPWSIDAALRREGRFGTTIFVPPPDLKTRIEIFRLKLKNKPIERDVSIPILARLTENFSGADIDSVCKYATELAIRDCIKNGIKRKINAEDFKKALLKKQPITLLWFKNALEKIKKEGNSVFYKDVVDYGYRILPKIIAEVI